jgi:transposase-like protein
MRTKSFSAEQMFEAIRRTDTGTSIESICAALNISRSTMHSWRKSYKLLSLEELKQVLALEQETSELRCQLSSLLKDRVVLLKVLRKPEVAEQAG